MFQIQPNSTNPPDPVMKNPSCLRAAFTASCLAQLPAFESPVSAAAPDLTAAGVIATIDRNLSVTP